MNKLDLHGIRHEDVDRLVENFIYMNQGKLPLTIVCGNSNKMIELVNNVVKRIKCQTTMLQYGVIKVINL
jgi:hypothetical protein